MIVLGASVVAEGTVGLVSSGLGWTSARDIPANRLLVLLLFVPAAEFIG